MLARLGSAAIVALLVVAAAVPAHAQSRKPTAREVAAVRACATRTKDDVDIAYRDTTCGFYGDKIQGTMAGFMEAACVARETARRAMLLAFFSRL